MAENRYYDALVQNINLEDITSSVHNADILRTLRDGHPDWNQELYILEDELDGDNDEFIVGEGDDLGWLGYFIGRSEVLQALVVDYLPAEGERMDALMRGITHNQSITKLSIRTDIGDEGFENLGLFLRSENALKYIKFQYFHVDTECGHNIAMALEQCRHDSLRSFELGNSNINEEGFAEIAATLRTQSQLENLHVRHNNIGRDGCVALGNLLRRWQSSNLKRLFLSNNNIDDLGLEALVEGMTNCSNLETVHLCDNRSITAAGIRSMSPLLQSESCSLTELKLHRINFGDVGAIALADGLRGTNSLRNLMFAPTSAGITDVGWSALSELLCDTSSINNTYLSNHTLERIGDGFFYDDSDTPPIISQYLAWNREERIDAALRKILESHPDLDMKPFFQWKLKFLPVIINWFGRVQEAGLKQSLGGRKLSSVYSFVRGMPMLVISQDREKTRRRSRKRRLDGETK
eukprot:scaffold1956_cov93-Skeletonema_dohrnii-CCMP3373.AAC.1